ncbi:DUF6271 family protein, partial [Streptomyces griseoincarnatus]
MRGAGPGAVPPVRPDGNRRHRAHPRPLRHGPPRGSRTCRDPTDATRTEHTRVVADLPATPGVTVHHLDEARQRQ